MKYIKPFLNESSENQDEVFWQRSNFKKILWDIHDFCNDLKLEDDQTKILFGVKLDSPFRYCTLTPLDQFPFWRLQQGITLIARLEPPSAYKTNAQLLQILIDTITQIHDYIISESLEITELSTTEVVLTKDSLLPHKVTFKYKSFPYLLRAIDWQHKENLNNIVGKVGGVNVSSNYLQRTIKSIDLEFNLLSV